MERPQGLMDDISATSTWFVEVRGHAVLDKTSLAVRKVLRS